MASRMFVRMKHSIDNYLDSYWWNRITDEEKQLRRMDAWQLAEVIHEANINKNNLKRIVAEHMLNVRLARIQARATHVATFFAVVGVVAGAFLAKSSEGQSTYVCECKSGSQVQQNVAAPIRDSVSPVVKLAVPEGNGIQAKSNQAENPNGKDRHDP